MRYTAILLSTISLIGLGLPSSFAAPTSTTTESPNCVAWLCPPGTYATAHGADGLAVPVVWPRTFGVLDEKDLKARDAVVSTPRELSNAERIKR